MIKVYQKLKEVGSKLALTLGLLYVSAVTSYAQNVGAGSNALSTATSTIKGYIPLVQKLIYAIAGVVALVGAISVFIKMNNEEQDVKKSIMMVVGACVFLVIAATALPAFFN